MESPCPISEDYVDQLLSPREHQCLRLVAIGFVSAAIAKKLGVSTRTVDHHITNAMRKLCAPTRAAAVAQALYQGTLRIELKEDNQPIYR